MSTRATYLFKGGKYNPDFCIYIHSDGYEQGAAAYFYLAFIAGGYALNVESMIRGNDRADGSLTTGHEGHGDCNYQYTIDGDMLQVKERTCRTDYEWVGIYNGPWYEFVNMHLDPAWIPEVYEGPIVPAKIQYTNGLFTPVRAAQEIEGAEKTLAAWSKDGPATGWMADDKRAKIEMLKGLQFPPPTGHTPCNAEEWTIFLSKLDRWTIFLSKLDGGYS